MKKINVLLMTVLGLFFVMFFSVYAAEDSHGDRGR